MSPVSYERQRIPVSLILTPLPPLVLVPVGGAPGVGLAAVDARVPELTKLFLMYLLAAMYGLLLVRVVFLFAIQFTGVDVKGVEEEVDITAQGFFSTHLTSELLRRLGSSFISGSSSRSSVAGTVPARRLSAASGSARGELGAS